MQSRLRKLKGFTLVELLVVLVIIAILAAVAAPIYFANTQRAKVSEAVATMSSVREAMRDYVASNGTTTGSYFDILATATAGNIGNPLPTTVTAGTPAPTTAGVAITPGTTQYFSSAAYTVTASTITTASTGTSGMFSSPGAQNFTILVNGSKSVYCATATAGTTDCAVKQPDVAGSTTGGVTSGVFCLEMDNSGRTFVSYNNNAACSLTGSTNWSSY